ncbi:hypothetical protein GQ54DRAFT_296376, partial [Martensiomyces pterosporus]
MPPVLDKQYVGVNEDNESPQLYQFIDYRAAASPDSHKRMPAIVKQIIESLTTTTALPGSAAETRSLPTLLLYDDHGLDLFDHITYLPEYYLTDCEIEVLKTNMDAIVAEIPDNSDVIELGCGSLRKTQILLDALNKRRKGVRYYAIDVMPQPLHASMGSMAPKFSNLSLIALCGTYDEVLVHFKKSTRPKTVLWLGSSIGNCTSSEAVEFLSGIASSALVPGDAIIIGMDRQKDPSIIMDAYHDSRGLTAEFELNALTHANSILCDYARRVRGGAIASGSGETEQPFDVSKFEYAGEYDELIGRHDAYLVALEDTSVHWPQEIAGEARELCGSEESLLIKQGERIYIESSYKYSESAPEVLAKAAGLTYTVSWADLRSYYSLNLFRKPTFSFVLPLAAPGLPLETGAASLDKWSEPARRASQIPNDARLRFSTIPTRGEWEHLWAAWDALSLSVIPQDKLLERAINLRHPFVFYLGHLPAFADIQMAAADGAPLTEPKAFAQWFERGIDPNVEDFSICHSHSEIPDAWPPNEDILAYRDRVRDRIRKWASSYEESVKNGQAVSIDAARHVWMVFEHEAMHIETMLYMVLQLAPSDIRPPVVCSIPTSRGAQPSESWITYKGQPAVTLGLLQDSEALLAGKQLPPGHVFGWDNESPAGTVSVNPFTIRTQPITNGEYMGFLRAVSAAPHGVSVDSLVPKSWVVLGLQDSQPGASHPKGCGLADDYGVRTVVGAPSIFSTEAGLWPVFVSQKQAAAYAKWCGKRLPSEAEWTHASRSYHLARALSANNTKIKYNDFGDVDSYLESAFSQHGTKASGCLQQPYDAHVPSDANIGFAHWHPLPVPTCAAPTSSDNGLPDATFVGNGWEWTSTQFHPFEGFQPSPMYPGYSADFF